MGSSMSRNGTFSSSNIHKLLEKGRNNTFSVAGLKYIKQVRYEQKLGRAINKEHNARATSWGKFIEGRVFNLLPLGYQLVSNKRLFHPEYSFWSGAPDLKKPLVVGDVKAPFSLETFCDKIEALQDIEVYKKEFPEDYWQHISNAILLEKNGHPVERFEAIIYVPYKSELAEIRDEAYWHDDEGFNVSFIDRASDEELPYLPDNGYYKNINIISFEIPKADKDLLTERVIEAGKLINPPIICHSDNGIVIVEQMKM